MPYEANVTDVAYRYDGSFAGFLCCVFESYARHEIPSEICPPEEGQLNLFGARGILTGLQRAKRGAAGLARVPVVHLPPTTSHPWDLMSHCWTKRRSLATRSAVMG